MIDIPPLEPFAPETPDAAGVLSWVHIGDLHMTVPGEKNHLDLLRIVEEVNAVLAKDISFVFLPGDIADRGDAAAYELVREAIGSLSAPWCAIVGDHDVHEKSFSHFLRFMANRTHYRFQAGNVNFFALNAFDVPDPGAFLMLSGQLVWLEEKLRQVPPDQSSVLLLHCYPSELKQGGGELLQLMRQYKVLLVEMGHTHYNEVSNDGRTLYIATRSTGQIEEGPAGYSITNIDGNAISWKFLPLGSLPAVVITSPADVRLLTEFSASESVTSASLAVRAKVWSRTTVKKVVARVGNHEAAMQRVSGSNVWQAELPRHGLQGIEVLHVEAIDEAGALAIDEIKVALGETEPEVRRERDQENALAAWPEHGLLGTQLGPNKYGKKW